MTNNITEKKQLALYKKLMKKCINLAKKGEGKTSPNPLVGAVVLDKNGEIAGYGWHKKYGEAHAEVNAIKMAENNKIDIKGGTIVVSLEPCSHYGKTPPCADLIIEKGLKTLVAGCLDPNPKVAGNGIKKCKSAGITVITGVLEDECKNLNEIFFKNQIEKKPFISIKTATTSDGKIATKTGSSKWITSKKARNDVQKLRNKYDAILTGSGTVIKDNPSLTCRAKNGKNPTRIIIDSKLKTPTDAKVYNDDGTKTYIATLENVHKKKYSDNVKIIYCPEKDGKVDLEYLTQKLFNLGIYSIIVEAGGILNGEFIKQKLADKLYQYIAPKIIGDEKAQNFIEGFDISDINTSQLLTTKKITKLTPDILIESNIHYI